MPWFEDARLRRLEGNVETMLRLQRAALRSSYRVEIKQERLMSELSDAIADLGAKVDADTAVDSSAITLLNGLTVLINQLKDQVAAAADVPAALAAVKTFASTLSSNQAVLAGAVSANTPAAPPTP